MNHFEQTYLKVPCRACGQVTPHTLTSASVHVWHCEVCRTDNFPLSDKQQYYTGWELAAFWHLKYRNARLDSARVALAQAPVMAGDETYWLEDQEQRPQYAVDSAQVFNVTMAEGFEGGVLVYKIPPEGYCMTPEIADDFAKLREEIVADALPYPSLSPVVETRTRTEDNYVELMDWSRDEQGYSRIHLASPLLWKASAKPGTVEVRTPAGADLAHLGDTICKHADGSLSVRRQQSIDPNSIGTL